MPSPTGVDDLYGLPLAEFTAARNALAKELTRQGDKEAAAEVKRLPKPAKTAWALNQLARRQPEVVSKLLAAGNRLRQAQQRALDGDAGGLRDATRAEQEQVGVALDAALELFGGATSDSAAAERLRRTLRAAATDPEVGALLREGRLVADVETAGFGLDDLSASAGTLPDDEPAPDGEDERERRQAQRDARRDADRLAKKAAGARERADRFREEAERAEQRAIDARAAAGEAEELAQEAEELATTAAREADRLG